MNARRAGIVAAVAVAVVVGGLIFGSQNAESDSTRPPPFPETLTVEPPPDFGPRPSPAECRAYWLGQLITGDDDAVEWAKVQFRKAGEPARLDVLHAAERSVRSNPALLEQALEFLLEDPRRDTIALARECLTNPDPFVVTRAASLLAAVGGRDAEEAAEQLAEAAATRENPVPRYALAALAEIGTPRCASAAMDAVSRMEPRWTGLGYVALGKIGGDEVIAFLRAAYEAERQTDPDLKMAAAEGLLVAGDDLPRPWLRSELDRLAEGSPLGEAALEVLANAADPAALGVLSERIRDRFDAPRAQAAVKLLANYPLHQKEALLVEAAAPGHSDVTRLDAWEDLVGSESVGAYDELLTMLETAGPRGSEEQKIAILVLGRLRRADSVGPLQRFLGFVAADDELRSLTLRALVLSGAPEAAKTVVAEVARDKSDYGSGGVPFNGFRALGSASAEMKAALATEIVPALEGRYGTPERNALQHLVLCAGVCGGPELAPVIEPFVMHADREVREAAITVLVAHGRDESVEVLRQAWRRRQDQYTRDHLLEALRAMHYRAR